MITKAIRSIALVLTVLITSCTSEDESPKKINFLPKVKHTEKTDGNKIIEIKNNQITQTGRVNEALNFDQAISAQYEGYEEVEFIFIPSYSSADEYSIYTFKEDKLTKLSLSVKNLENSIVINNEAGEVVVNFEDNLVKEINVSYTDNSASSGRISKECSPAKDFIAYEGAVQQQLIDSVGYWGALAIDVACSAWIVCRGAVVAAGVIYAVGNCVS